MASTDNVPTKRATGPRTPLGKKMSAADSLKDGSSSPLIVTQVARTIRKSYLPWLKERWPWLSEAEDPAVELLILKRAKLVLLHRYLAEHGENDADGNIRTQAERADRLASQLFGMLERLGGTPPSRNGPRAHGLSPNPRKDTDGRREDSGRGW